MVDGGGRPWQRRGRDRQVGAAGDARTALPSCPGGSKRIQVGGITLAIVLLIPRAGPAWLAAFHRFVEVSIGIGVALMLTVVWLEREAAPLLEKVKDSPRKADGDQGRLNASPRSPAALPPATDERS